MESFYVRSYFHSYLNLYLPSQVGIFAKLTADMKPI